MSTTAHPQLQTMSQIQRLLHLNLKGDHLPSEHLDKDLHTARGGQQDEGDERVLLSSSCFHPFVPITCPHHWASHATWTARMAMSRKTHPKMRFSVLIS